METDADAPETEPCPACGTALPLTARLCWSCRQDLTSFRAARRAIETAERTRADAAAGAFRPVPEGVFRRIRTVTVAWAGALVLFGLMVLPAWTSSDGFLIALAVVGWIFGFVSLVLLLVYGIQDLLLLAPEKLTTPAAAYRTYLKCLREKRWAYAWHLVAPRGREGSRARPAMAGTRVEAGSFPMDSPAGLAAYWKPLLHSTGWMTRTCSIEPPQVAVGDAESAMAGCQCKVSSYPWPILLPVLCGLPGIAGTIVLYFVLRKTEEFPLDIPLARVDGRWYLLDAAPALPGGGEGG
jgi:hypothetical protein